MAQNRRVKTFREEVTGDFVTDCGDFEVLDDFVLEGRAITFFDRDGNEVSARVHLAFQDRFYNSVTGKEIKGSATVNVELDLPSEREISSAGRHYHVTLPGEGAVLLDAGKLRLDEEGNTVFEGGHHPILSGEDSDDLSERERELLAKFCRALGDS